MNRIEQMTGHPVAAHHSVDADLIAETRGPDALDRAIEAAPHDELLARYKAALWRINHDRAMQPRIAAHAFAAAEQQAEDRNDRSWTR